MTIVHYITQQQKMFPLKITIIDVGMIMSAVNIFEMLLSVCTTIYELVTPSVRSLSKLCFCYAVVRFILDDSALYLSDKCESDTVDLRRGKTHDTRVYMLQLQKSCRKYAFLYREWSCCSGVLHLVVCSPNIATWLARFFISVYSVLLELFSIKSM